MRASKLDFHRAPVDRPPGQRWWWWKPILHRAQPPVPPQKAAVLAHDEHQSRREDALLALRLRPHRRDRRAIADRPKLATFIASREEAIKSASTRKGTRGDQMTHEHVEAGEG